MARVRVYGTMHNNKRKVSIGGRCRSEYVYATVEFDTGREETRRDKHGQRRVVKSERDRNAKAELNVDWGNPGVGIKVRLPKTDEQVSVFINEQKYKVDKDGQLHKIKEGC